MLGKLKKKLFHLLRQEYGNTPLLEEELAQNPVQQFSFWISQAIKAEVFEPNGMLLATASLDAHPSSRTVLLKEFDQTGFVFFTHLESRKGKQLLVNPCASATFWWKEIYRQVNIEGSVKKISRAEVSSYFSKRPKGARLAALASHQSEPLCTREQLDDSFEKLKKKYRGKTIPCPSSWGGYRLIPERMEFWQGRQNRLHDRFVYIRVNGEWVVSRLAP